MLLLPGDQNWAILLKNLPISTHCFCCSVARIINIHTFTIGIKSLDKLMHLKLSINARVNEKPITRGIHYTR